VRLVREVEMEVLASPDTVELAGTSVGLALSRPS